MPVYLLKGRVIGNLPKVPPGAGRVPVFAPSSPKCDRRAVAIVGRPAAPLVRRSCRNPGTVFREQRQRVGNVGGRITSDLPTKTKQHRVDPSTRNACGYMSGREARHNRKSSACHASNNSSPKRVSLRVSVMKIRHPQGHHRRGSAPHHRSLTVDACRLVSCAASSCRPSLARSEPWRAE